MNSITTVHGVKLLYLYNPSDISFFGIATKNGTNYEPEGKEGVSHFCEHLFFKGTDKRTWKELNYLFAQLGVYQNAYTDSNEVLYHVTCPSINIEKTVELLMDMFFFSSIPQEEFDKEKGVIIEEKNSIDDDPKSSFEYDVIKRFFSYDKGHHPIGTNKSIKGFQRQDVINYLDSTINLSNFMYIYCGNKSLANITDYIHKSMPCQHRYFASGPLNSISNEFWNPKPLNRKFIVKKNDISQASLNMVVRGPAYNTKDYRDAAVLCRALGGGMYSLLFSRIREELGLCYNVGMSDSAISYPDHNAIYLYGSTSPKNIDLFVEESEKIIKDVMKNGIDYNLYNCAHTQCMAAILRATETSMGKALYLTRRHLYGEVCSVESMIEGFKNVTFKDCNDAAEKLFNTDYKWAILKPV